MTNSEVASHRQKHIEEKCRRDRHARRGAIAKIGLYAVGAGCEIYADIYGHLPTVLTLDNLFGFGGATVAAGTSMYATHKNNKHEDQLEKVADRNEDHQIDQKRALRETEYHIDHRRKDTKRYIGLTAGGTVLSAFGFGHSLLSGHMDNHPSLIAAALSIFAANAYSVYSIAHGVRNIRDDKAQVKHVARLRKNEP